MLEPMTITLDDVLTRLHEAARCARRGNAETAQMYIGGAIALLERGAGNTLAVTRLLSEENQTNASGALLLWRARRITDYIESNLFGSIRIDDLAAVVGLSNSHFCRAFRLRFGLTAHAYIIFRRIQASQDLMLRTDAPLSEIALRCGMCDQAHFSRVFRRIVGEAPNRWRQARRNSSANGGDHIPTAGVVNDAAYESLPAARAVKTSKVLAC
jgi:AraC family transcriptional regulator